MRWELLDGRGLGWVLEASDIGVDPLVALGVHLLEVCGLVRGEDAGCALEESGAVLPKLFEGDEAFLGGGFLGFEAYVEGVVDLVLLGEGLGELFGLGVVELEFLSEAGGVVAGRAEGFAASGVGFFFLLNLSHGLHCQSDAVIDDGGNFLRVGIDGRLRSGAECGEFELDGFDVGAKCSEGRGEVGSSAASIFWVRVQIVPENLKRRFGGCHA